MASQFFQGLEPFDFLTKSNGLPCPVLRRSIVLLMANLNENSYWIETD
jgi:hypothetical protein